MSTINPLNNSTVETGYAVGSIVNTDGTIGKKSSDGSTVDKDSFLKLLVAQLKYQDPMNPADSGEFMAQSAQFSMLETLQNMQTQQTQMLNAERSVSATNMLGQKITAVSASGGDDIVGVVTGVKLGTDGPVLKVGDMEVLLSSVKEVAKP